MSPPENTAAPPQHSNPSTSPATDKATDDNSILGKGKKLLGLGKKKEAQEDKQTTEQAGATAPTTTLLPSPPMSPPERRASPRGSPRMLPIGAPSPNRRIRSTSPGLHSPASSLIFERNVQEPEPSADVPAHIKTEDHIPPALDATSLAITDNHLNPDDVEIVTHSAHQPASAAVAGSISDSIHSPPLPHEESLASSHADVNEAPGYGALDTNDPRRLSFISFADVVQAEHVEHDRQEVLGATTSGEALQFMSLSSTANRSSSPVRSAASSPPTTSGAASPKHTDLNRTRSPASPTSLTTATVIGSPNPAIGEELPVQIETMRQALRKTRSGDMGGARSQPLSAASVEENGADKPPFKS
jgi:hypothetical protein